ncbi:hypothetical protein, partial [Escherichia coli]|uniref:hypothetical protein n=1 Tax=Escherichia coli TaxID=562 RepID=UPI003CE4FCC4
AGGVGKRCEFDAERIHRRSHITIRLNNLLVKYKRCPKLSSAPDLKNRMDVPAADWRRAAALPKDQ